MINIKLNGVDLKVKQSSRIEELAAIVKPKLQIYGALVNNVVKSLAFEVKEGDRVQLLGISDPAGYRIYESTLLLVLFRAAKALFPEKVLNSSYSLGGGIFFKWASHEDMSAEQTRMIKEEMKRLIDASIRINKIKLPLENAKKFAEKHDYITSLELLDYFKKDLITLYELDGYNGYYYAKTLLYTSQISGFDLVPYSTGCVLLGIDPKNPGRVKTLVKQDNIHRELQSYEKWCDDLDVSDVASLNRKVKEGKITNLITIAESRHESQINKMAEYIAQRKGEKRIILIAGPSSAGKTTTSKRLRNHLIARGLRPVEIALDDYFVDRAKTPVDEYGEVDFECIDAIDVELFNEQLDKLMEGSEVTIPIFDFIEGRRCVDGRCLRVDLECPIIIEGIHALNDELTAHIAKENKYKIYINDLTHLNLDVSNRIPTSDVRLIRRIVRDKVKRGHNALATIRMWQSVRRGEDKNIYPYSSDADFVFNTSLLYEMGVLKKYAEPALKEIGNTSEYYHEAERLLDFLSFFVEIKDESAIYTNSILREFIGGNVFDNL